MKTNCFLLIFTLLFISKSFSQQCGNCKETPSIALYDLDVQVAKPNVYDLKSNEWLEWLQLFWLNKHAQSAVFKNNKNCIRFIQPYDARISGEAFTTSDGIEVPPLVDEGQQIKVGETYTNLPPSGDLSKFAEYIITGYVKKSGDGYVMHVEVQTSCSRKTVAVADVPFRLTVESSNTTSIANQAVAQLSPLVEKIKNFELAERNADKKMSLFNTSWGEPMKITVVKKGLKQGESTDFTIEVKDCDGVPLQGREIIFTEGSVNGFKIFGTMGGSVSPAKVTTDANGIAKAKFTLKAGAKEAVINAHSLGTETKGCASLLIGDAFINIKKSYSGHLKYSWDESDNCTERTVQNCATYTSSGSLSFKVDYQSGFNISNESYDSEEEGKPNAVPDVMESGSMVYRMMTFRGAEITCGAGSTSEQVVTKNQSGGLKTASARFSFEKEFQSVDVNVKFQLKGKSSFKQTHLQGGSTPIDEEYSHNVSFNSYDKNFSYKKTVTNGVIKHTATYLRIDNTGCKQIVERMQIAVVEE